MIFTLNRSLSNTSPVLGWNKIDKVFEKNGQFCQFLKNLRLILSFDFHTIPEDSLNHFYSIRKTSTDNIRPFSTGMSPFLFHWRVPKSDHFCQNLKMAITPTGMTSPDIWTRLQISIDLTNKLV